MRSRRRFQPSLDQLAARIAPSAIVAMDTDMPETGTSVPVIIAPDPAMPDPVGIPTQTLLC